MIRLRATACPKRRVVYLTTEPTDTAAVCVVLTPAGERALDAYRREQMRREATELARPRVN